MKLTSYARKLITTHLGDYGKYFIQIYDISSDYIKACKKLKYAQIPKVKFYSDEETIEMVINNRKSISRYGDGEIRWMAGITLDSFQSYSENLAKDLKKSFNSPNVNILIGLPYAMFYPKKCNLFARMYWKIILANNFELLNKLLDPNRIYMNASITRPYIDYTDKATAEKTFGLVKKIWENKDILILEGEMSKLGIGNDLFNNAKSINRIICPSINAYEKKNEIKQFVLENISKDIMILGALGPTASILAAELAEVGYQFIDIGHIDLEYMWYLKGAIIKEPIPGKYVNECKNKEILKNLYNDDPMYTSSIIAKIC